MDMSDIFRRRKDYERSEIPVESTNESTVRSEHLRAIFDTHNPPFSPSLWKKVLRSERADGRLKGILKREEDNLPSHPSNQHIKALIQVSTLCHSMAIEEVPDESGTGLVQKTDSPSSVSKEVFVGAKKRWVIGNSTVWESIEG